MADIVDSATRSKMMSGIRGKNTKPELVIRKALFKAGFRYRLHDRHLPGKPDLVFAKYRAVIFIHGCFWHRHHCRLFRWPKTRMEFWQLKLNGNVRTDRIACVKLREDGWRVLVVWECAIRGKKNVQTDALVSRIIEWLLNEKRDAEING